jgi:hypothetical protein
VIGIVGTACFVRSRGTGIHDVGNTGADSLLLDASGRGRRGGGKKGPHEEEFLELQHYFGDLSAPAAGTGGLGDWCNVDEDGRVTNVAGGAGNAGHGGALVRIPIQEESRRQWMSDI